jgi:long-chain acyl-CoA synthetase
MIIQSGSKTALRIGEKAVSYSKLIQKTHLVSEKIANKQGRAIIFSENREAWTYAFLAVWNVGMVPVPVDFMSVAADVQYVLNDSKPSIIFSSEKCLPVLEKALQGTTLSPEIILLDSLEEPTTKQFPSELHLGINPEDTAVIIYTSGTTGKSKGVMLSFKNLQANIDAVCSEIGIFTPDDRVLMLLPLHHILPLMGTLIMPLSVGCTIAMSPSMASEDIVRTLKDNKITMIIGVPRLYSSIRKGIMDKVAKSIVAKMLFAVASRVNSLKFSRIVFSSVHKKFGGSVKYMVSGGAALDTSVFKDFRTLGFEILEGYGMSEAAPMISFNHPGKTKQGSAGIVLSCVNAEIRDNEFVVSGPNVMQGYFEKPDETSEVIKDGWLYTGDLGHIDENGFIYITGRKKEIMVLSNGKNINPSEIEEQLEAISPVIKEAGVFQDGDRIRAIIVPDNIKKQEFQIDNIEKYLLKEVIQVYNHSVVPYKMIVQLTVSEKELPRTRLGKIQRFLLPSMAVEQTQQEQPQEEIRLEEYVMLKDYIKQEKKIDVKPNDHLIMNIGLDSLERVGLQVFIETSFGISIEMEQLTKFENILELSHYLHEHKKHTSIEFINWSNILKQKIHLKLPSTWITSNIMVKMSHMFFKVFFRYKAKGAYHIPQGPCIIVANHQSFLDGLFVAAHLKYSQMRKTFFYAKEKHVSNSFLKFLANRNNIIVMDLNNNLKESIQKMAEVLKTEKNLIIFPEGTRTKDGSLGDFKKTFAILSCELNVPVIPVSIHGAFEAMPRGRVFPTPFRRIKVDFLSPVYPGSHSYESLSELVRSNIEKNLYSHR